MSAGVRVWLGRDLSRLYVKLVRTGRMENIDFHEEFIRPLQTLGFRFDPGCVAHFIEIDEPREYRLLIRQLEANFDVNRLERNEIRYQLGLEDL